MKSAKTRKNKENMGNGKENKRNFNTALSQRSIYWRKNQYMKII